MQKNIIPFLIILLFITASAAIFLNIQTKNFNKILLDPILWTNIALIIFSIFLQYYFHDSEKIKNVFRAFLQIIALITTLNTTLYTTTQINIQINNQYQAETQKNYNYVIQQIRNINNDIYILFGGK